MEAFHVLDEVAAAFVPFGADLLVTISMFEVSRSELWVSAEESKCLMSPADRLLKFLHVIRIKACVSPVLHAAHPHVVRSTKSYKKTENFMKYVLRSIQFLAFSV
jgi:hypothetical protein